MKEKSKRKVGINIVKANGLALMLFLAAAVIAIVPFLLIWSHTDYKSLHDQVSFFLIMFLGIPLHEGLHGLTFGLLTKGGFKTISFGIIWKYLTPYCHCSEPISRGKFIAAAMMPCIVLGFIPILISWFTGLQLLAIYGIIFVSAASGDVWMTYLIMKEPKDALYLDDDKEAAFWVIQ